MKSMESIKFADEKNKRQNYLGKFRSFPQFPTGE